MTIKGKLGQAPTRRNDLDVATEYAECEPETATERLSELRLTEECHGSVTSVRSANSVSSASSTRSVHSVYSVEYVIQNTLPTSSDDWKASLFKFTRALKIDCGMWGGHGTKIRPHVEQWYKEAGPVLGDVPFSDVLGEVLTSWDRAKHPVFRDVLNDALETARQQGTVPAVPGLAGYDEADVALAYRLLFWLTQDNRDFFISCRALGERLEIDHTKAWRILRMFEADGIIMCVKRGKRPKASRYRWYGNVTPSMEP